MKIKTGTFIAKKKESVDLDLEIFGVSDILLKVNGHRIPQGPWETGHSEVLWGKHAGCVDERTAIRKCTAHSRGEWGMTSDR